MSDLTRYTIRALLRQKRNTLSISQKNSAANALIEQLHLHPQIQIAKRIALYLPIDGEIDTFPLIQWLWLCGKELYLPIIHPLNATQLLFVHYHSTTRLKRHKWGMLQPTLVTSGLLPAEKLDLLFMPLVGFDKKGNRLGFGGGVYDRLLSSLSSSTAYTIGLAYDEQCIDSLPVEFWDIPLSEIATPSQIWRFI